MGVLYPFFLHTLNLVKMQIPLVEDKVLLFCFKLVWRLGICVFCA